MKQYLSFGGGVNSVALLLWLKDQGIEAEAVFADHGADWPETYEYVQMLQDRGYAITVLYTQREGMALYDYYLSYRIIPLRFMRHCTDHFKVRPLRKYFQQPCVVYLGIDAGESHRARPSGVAGLEYRHPLVDEGIDRQACINIIRAHHLPVPMKSGCYICPFQRMSQWRELYSRHPDLYRKAQILEDTTNARLAQAGKAPVYLAHERPLHTAAMEGQTDMFDDTRAVTPCLCGL